MIRENQLRGYRHYSRPAAALDYYPVPGGVYVEEFLLNDDFTAAAVDSAVWSAAGGWRSSADFCRRVRDAAPADISGGADDARHAHDVAIGDLLAQLRAAARRRGLIPLTVLRFA